MLIRPCSKVIVRFLTVMMKHGKNIINSFKNCLIYLFILFSRLHRRVRNRGRPQIRQDRRQLDWQNQQGKKSDQDEADVEIILILFSVE